MLVVCRFSKCHSAALHGRRADVDNASHTSLPGSEGDHARQERIRPEHF